MAEQPAPGEPVRQPGSAAARLGSAREPAPRLVLGTGAAGSPQPRIRWRQGYGDRAGHSLAAPPGA